jgi:5'-nucleotidase
MKILISNDDGYNGEGIIALAKRFSLEHEVTIFAPENQRSAFSQSITMANPLRVTKVSKEKNLTIYHVNGTPADCVKIGLNLMDKLPDLVLSGINKGANTGFNTRYSGTVGAAFEGVIKGIPSFALSLAIDKNLKPNFENAADYSYNLITKILGSNFDFTMTLLNINIPSISNIKGIRTTYLNKNFYDDQYEKRVDTFGKDYYWLSGEFPMDSLGEGSDQMAVNNGYISVTPLKVDQTYHEKLELLNSIIPD